MAEKEKLIKKYGIEIEEFLNKHPNLDSFTRELISNAIKFGYNVGHSEAHYDFEDNPYRAAKSVERMERINRLLGLEERLILENDIKHPANITGYNSPEETAEDLANLNFFSNKIIYNDLIYHYRALAEHAKDRHKIKLYSDLIELSNAFKLVNEKMRNVCNNHEKHTPNPFKNSGEKSD